MGFDGRQALTEDARRRFVARFGAEPTASGVAPARVNLIGEHTDYADGFVLPAALPLYTCVLVSRASGETTTLVSSGFGEATVPASTDGAFDGFVRYLAGAIRQCGLAGEPLNILVHGNMPVEAGLSSSASLLVAAVAALDRLGGHARPPIEVARAARAVENDYVGVPCGFMDQFAVACSLRAHAALLDCLDNTHTHVPAAIAGHSWVVLYSGLRRELSGGGYAAKVQAVKQAMAKLEARGGIAPGHLLRTHSEQGVRMQAEQAGVASEHLPLLAHIASENARVHLLRHALFRSDAAMAGTLLRLGHESLSRQFGVSLPAIDRFAEQAYGIAGVVGVRLTGAGMGGSLVLLVSDSGLDQALDELETTARATMHHEARAYAVPEFVDGVVGS